MNSVELSILIECCKVSLLQIPTQKLESLVHQQNPDWDKLMKMASYHRIRPVVYNAFLSLQVQNDFVANLRKFTLSQSIYNLNNSNELSKILSLLNAQNIRVLPYKGALFQSEFYNNRSLRESGDIDIYVHPDDDKLALHLLIKDGYELSVEGVNHDLSQAKLIDSIVDAYGRNEVCLQKTNEKGLKVNIDFHWALYVNYFDYDISANFFFETAEQKNVQSNPIPSYHSMFIMLLIHHGARNCWLTLKYICDLLMLLKSKGNQLNWQELESVVEKAKMKRSMILGLELLKEQLEVDLTEYKIPKFEEKNNPRLHKKIKKFWEESAHFVTLKPRIEFEKILIKMQDDGFSKWNYFKKFSKYYSHSTFTQTQEPKLLVSMQGKSTILNLLGKTITYFYYKSVPKRKIKL